MYRFRLSNLRGATRLFNQAKPLFLQPGNERHFSVSKHLLDVSCMYRSGYAVFTLPLPSRQEDCEFSMKPVSQTVKHLVNNVQEEDRGVDRVALYTMEGKRIANVTPIEMLIQQNFKIRINDKAYDVITPKPESFPLNPQEDLSKVKSVVSQLYTDLNLQNYREHREQSIKEHLENLKEELSPLEQKKLGIDAKAAKRTDLLIWAGLGYLALQLGFLARLTWWEYSWDIMEPVTYFVTFFSSIIFYAYFVLTKQDCSYPDARNRSHMLTFHRESKRANFDTHAYNAKKEQVRNFERELLMMKSAPVFVDITKPIIEQNEKK